MNFIRWIDSEFYLNNDNDYEKVVNYFIFIKDLNILYIIEIHIIDSENIVTLIYRYFFERLLNILSFLLYAFP